jgi:hypothetical protein
MTDNELIDIVIAPNVKVNEEITQQVATILSRDLRDIRTLLTSKFPRIISQQTDLQKVEDILHRLGTLGFVAFAYKDDELKKPIRLFKANSIEFADNHILIKDKNNQLLKLEKESVF